MLQLGGEAAPEEPISCDATSLTNLDLHGSLKKAQILEFESEEDDEENRATGCLLGELVANTLCSRRLLCSQ